MTWLIILLSVLLVYSLFRIRSLIDILELRFPCFLEYVIRMHIEGLNFDCENLNYKITVSEKNPLISAKIYFLVKGSQLLRDLISRLIHGILVTDASGNISIVADLSKELLKDFPIAKEINEGIPIPLGKEDYLHKPLKIKIIPRSGRGACFLKLKATHIPKSRKHSILSLILLCFGIYRIRVEYTNHPIKMIFEG